MKKVSKGHLLPRLRTHTHMHAVPFLHLVVSYCCCLLLFVDAVPVIEIINMDLEYIPSHGPRSSLLLYY